MFSNLCPLCRRVNAANAWRCDACRAYLRDRDMQPSPMSALAEGQSAGPLWFDDLGEPPRATCPTQENGAAAPSIILRDIDPDPVLAASVAVQPPGEELVMSDPVVQSAFIAEAPINGTPQVPLAADATLRAQRKAANRRKVRRARLRDSAVANGTAPAAPEVLVADADDGAREQLCSLLRAFGFGVRSAVDSAEAAALAAASPFAAAFVEVALTTADGGDGIDLCKQVREVSPRGEGGAPPVLALVAAQLQPMDRVRAKLAGCDEVILKPVTRGSVARLLDARGVALPSDARRI